MDDVIPLYHLVKRFVALKTCYEDLTEPIREVEELNE